MKLRLRPAIGAATRLGQAVTFTDRNVQTPKSMQWNLNVQQSLPGSVVLEVGYAGNRSLNLTGNLQLNQLPDSALALGDALRELAPNPFFGQITIGPLSSRTVTRAQLLRPFPQFDAVTAANATYATSTYHALVVSANRRFTRGLALNASYTFSKLLDQATGPFAGETLGGGAIQSVYNLRSEWSISELDAPHRFVLNGIWALPFGARRGQAPKGVADAIVGGWELSGIYAFQSGNPLGVTSTTNTTFSLGGGQRPDLKPGVDPVLPASERTINRWFNPDAFAAPPQYTYGSSPRTFGNLRADRLSNVDFSVIKNTRLTERFTLQFRSEFFNLLNTPRFAPPNVNFGNPQFGRVNNQTNQSRVVQFALKLLY